MFDSLVRVLELLGTWGIVYMIWKEGKELVQQQALELKQRQLEAFRFILERLQSESAREDRRTIYNAEVDRKAPGSWPDSVRKAAESTAAHFDEVATLIERGGLEESDLLPAWAHPIAASWESVEPLVLYQRRRFAQPDRWTRFEALARKAKTA